MEVIRKLLLDLITKYPLLTVIFILGTILLAFNKLLNVIVKVKITAEENKDLLKEVKENQEEQNKKRKDNLRLLSHDLSDELTSILQNLIDRLNNINNKICQVLTILNKM